VCVCVYSLIGSPERRRKKFWK